MKNTGTLIISFAVFTTALVSVIVDWNSSHIFNPDWPPHARFHDVLLLIFMSQLAVLFLWLMWKPGAGWSEHVYGFLYVAFFWSPFFYITFLVPSSSLGLEPEPPASLGSIPIYPNVIVGLVEIVIAGVGLWFYKKQPV